MRVVAGRARGRRLTVPKGLDIRPTSDRVREALFSILGPRVPGASVLDLCCGSGALSVEALSRGAKRATLVDRAPAALASARENLERAGVAQQAQLVRSSIERFLLRPCESVHDLVFLDPPYVTPLDSVGSAVGRLVDGGFLVPGALVVVERSSEGEEPVALGPLPVAEARRYGTTRLLFAVAD